MGNTDLSSELVVLNFALLISELSCANWLTCRLYHRSAVRLCVGASQEVLDEHLELPYRGNVLVTCNAQQQVEGTSWKLWRGGSCLPEHNT